jgi:hypothetical protein
LPLELLLSAYDKASEWLAEVQSAGLLARLNQAARKVIARLQSEKRPEGADVLFKGLYFPDEVLKFERGLIRAALAEVNGSVTHAAGLLGIGYQRLARVPDESLISTVEPLTVMAPRCTTTLPRRTKSAAFTDRELLSQLERMLSTSVTIFSCLRFWPTI